MLGASENILRVSADKERRQSPSTLYIERPNYNCEHTFYSSIFLTPTSPNDECINNMEINSFFEKTSLQYGFPCAKPLNTNAENSISEFGSNSMNQKFNFDPDYIEFIKNICEDEEITDMQNISNSYNFDDINCEVKNSSPVWDPWFNNDYMKEENGTSLPSFEVIMKKQPLLSNFDDAIDAEFMDKFSNNEDCENLKEFCSNKLRREIKFEVNEYEQSHDDDLAKDENNLCRFDSMVERIDIPGTTEAIVSFQCKWKGCFESYDQQSSLVNHIEKVHIDIKKGEEFSCQWLDCQRNLKPFNARYKLLIHMRVHSGDKPNKCLVSYNAAGL